MTDELRKGGKMAQIRDDFSRRASEYDREIIEIVPHYDVMLNTLVESLPFETEARIKVVDLGTGTGTLAWRVRQRFPQARMLCIDMTEKMMEIAKERFQEDGQVDFLEKDFYHLDIPEGQDAVVASLSLHHLVTDEDKRSFYRKVHRCLNFGGVFVNADAVLSSDDWVEELYMRKWREYMAKKLDDEGIGNILERYRREDSLPRLLDQLHWLEEAGFSSVDVIWKHHMGAVVWARK